MLEGNVEIWGLGEEGRKKKIKPEAQTNKPASVQTEWAACIISVTSVVTETAS